MSSKSEIAISGVSGRFPDSDTTKEFWKNLIGGVDMVTTNNCRWPEGFLGIPRRKGTLKADLTKFDSNFFGIFPKQAERLDPQLRLLLEVTYEAILDAGVNPHELRGKSVGVYVGASAHDTYEACRKHPETASGHDMTGSSCCMLANRISYAFDLQGPSFCIDTFCSSSMMALHQAILGIRAGDCEAAIVAGVNLLLNPVTSLQINEVGALSTDGKCKVFDASADGFARSEAIVSIFLQKHEVARRCYGILVHSKSNADGYKVKGVSYPAGAVQQKLLEATYKEAGVDPLDVFYVEPHGTGTPIGDPQEVNAISAVFANGRSADNPLLIGATKSNMGHAEPAAALCGLVKVALAINNGIIPPNLHFQAPNPNIPALLDGSIRVVSKSTPVTGTLFGISSTGIGGSNIHAILKKDVPEKFEKPRCSLPILLPFSGRTKEAVNYALSEITEMSKNFEFAALLHKIAEIPISNHDFRGYAILNEPSDPPPEVQEIPKELPPLWFIFSGMGTLWKGMVGNLMEIKIFADSIQKSEEILQPLGLHIRKILLKGHDELLQRHMGACFVAMGVAIIDVLNAIGLKPDGFIGHSAGEILCGYIDGVIGHREALLCYFFKDECVRKCQGGGMAAVGLTWEEATFRCPDGVYPACHNAETNVTVSGPDNLVNKFIGQLQAEGIFARKIDTGGVAYHSRYLSPVLPIFEAHARAIVINTKQRSEKWRSTSLRKEDSGRQMANSQYIINNMRSPVLFHSTVTENIPPNAVVLEVSSHALFVSILKKSLPSTCHVIGLIRKTNGNTVTQLLNAVGKLYQLGYNLNLSAIYPPVQFPVSVGTPMISPLVKWDHSKSHSLPDYLPTSSGLGESKIEISLLSKTHAYLTGHCVDGRIIYPGAAYLVLLWKKFASLQGIPYLQLPVKFENIRFQRATILHPEGTVKLVVNIYEKLGEFQITEGDTIVVSGKITLAEKNELLASSFIWDDPDKTSTEWNLSTEDAYKELRLRGLCYTGVFKTLQLVDSNGKWARIKWCENWVGFLDSLLQLQSFPKENGGPYVPIAIRKVTINPITFLQAIAEDRNNSYPGIPSTYNSELGKIQCPGIEILGVGSALVSRLLQTQTPILEEMKWLPYVDNDIMEEDNALKCFVDLAIENLQMSQIHVCEQVALLSDSWLLSILPLFALQPQKSFELVVVSEDLNENIECEMKHHGIKLIPNSYKGYAQILLRNTIENVSEFEEQLDETGFLLLKLANEVSVEFANLTLVSTRRTNATFFYAYRKKQDVDIPKNIINIDDSNFGWIGKLQTILSDFVQLNSELPIYVTSSTAGPSGIVGLVNCIRQELGGKNVRCIFSRSGNIDLEDTKCPLVQSVLEGDLVMNVIINGTLGSYRHVTLRLDKIMDRDKPKYAFVNAESRGDLSSLKFIEGPDPHYQVSDPKVIICDVHYAAINFRDVMLATGKLPPEALPGKLAAQECVLGLEFAGLDDNGQRIMGMVNSKGLATHVMADRSLTWPVPSNWTMDEAATVPVAYATAYYSLISRGNMRNHESILIHSGSGGVGQAAIAIALSMKCQVFVTVGSNVKREFLKSQFPELKDENFANSRDTLFEDHILKHTNGRGVDLVINSLAGEKLQASLRCLAEGGRFLEIGKYDLSKNTALGMNIFLKNTTFHGILLDSIFDKSCEEKSQIFQLVSQGIQDGIVRALPRQIFPTSQIEEAFRFMASGKHIGKILIRMRSEDPSGVLLHSEVISARLRTYFDQSKVYIIIGGLGGFGFEFAGWIISRGARKVVLVSRSTKLKNAYQASRIRKWETIGVNLKVMSNDVTTLEGTFDLIRSCKSNLGEIGGIFNLAMILKDGLFQNQCKATFEAVTKPKVDTTLNLDKVCRQLCADVEHFVVFSSLASGRGNAGQSNYGYANSYMERICEKRKQDGLSSLAIQFGPIADVGIFYEEFNGGEKVIVGRLPQKLNSCFHVLNLLLSWKHLTIVASTVFADMTFKISTRTQKSLVESVAKILGVSQVTNTSNILGELGIDSLMLIELKQLLEISLQVTFSPEQIRQLTWDKLEEMDKNKQS